MSLPFEVLLVVGALAFYLYDSSALLYADELLLERVGRGWRAHAGSATLIAGRRPFLPNPLAPHRALLRVSLPDLLGDGPPRRDELGHFLNALQLFQVLSGCLLLLFFPGLPLVLYGYGNGVGLLCWMAAVYLALSCIVVATFRRRRVLELSLRQWLELSVEVFCCAPFAINIVRRLSLRSKEITLAGVGSLLDAHSQHALRRAGGERIAEMLGRWDDGSPQAETLRRYRQRLAQAEPTR